MVFEVQENSDVTFRLYDWDHVDAKTASRRDLQVEQAIACIDFAQGAVGPVVPVVEEMKPVLRERLFLVNILGCGDFVEKRRLWSGRRERRVCWSASPATVSWSTMAPLCRW